MPLSKSLISTRDNKLLLSLQLAQRTLGQLQRISDDLLGRGPNPLAQRDI